MIWLKEKRLIVTCYMAQLCRFQGVHLRFGTNAASSTYYWHVWKSSNCRDFPAAGGNLEMESWLGCMRNLTSLTLYYTDNDTWPKSITTLSRLVSLRVSIMPQHLLHTIDAGQEGSLNHQSKIPFEALIGFWCTITSTVPSRLCS